MSAAPSSVSQDPGADSPGTAGSDDAEGGVGSGGDD
jgi:hypothetical protein